ncbi:MAG: avidin family protein [Alphaproteobacteria bacterium]|nr:avidin family protein [Alphaproteobacteria bacterium]
MLHEQALHTAALTPGAAPQPDFSGRWRNQMASFMDLSVNGSNVTGTYNSAASATGGSVQGAVIGVTVGDLIALTVLWTQSGSITSWTGQLIDDSSAPKLRTLWHLVTNVPDDQEPGEFWMSTWAGADEFVR